MIEFLRTFFAINHDIIFFVYGLVFFVLGLAIALQSRNFSRLDLARSLKWLAAFGFAHGFHEWGDLFIPIQSVYLSTAWIGVLHSIHLLLLALSFAFLFEFGCALLQPLGKARWLRSMSAILLLAWLLVVEFPLRELYPDFDTWHNMSNALARYFIGFPGGLLAAYALRKHAYQRIVPLNVPHIVRVLRFGGIMLGIYAILGGLVPPPVPVFPGNVLNSATFEQILTAPPAVFRSIVGLGLAIAIIRALEVFNVEIARMIETMEQHQILTAERNRIARDLHDGAIQKVYTAGLLIESANMLGQAGPVSDRLDRAENVLNDAINDLRRNLTELHSTPKSEPLPVALRRVTDDPRFKSLMDVSLEVDLLEAEQLSPVRSEHILAIVNEALSNAARHSRAKKVRVAAKQENGRLRVSIEDNGSGIAKDHQAGYGLRNMRDRARLLGGEIKIESKNGKGTQIILDIPWKDEA